MEKERESETSTVTLKITLQKSHFSRFRSFESHHFFKSFFLNRDRCYAYTIILLAIAAHININFVRFFLLLPSLCSALLIWNTLHSIGWNDPVVCIYLSLPAFYAFSLPTMRRLTTMRSRGESGKKHSRFIHFEVCSSLCAIMCTTIKSGFYCYSGKNKSKSGGQLSFSFLPLDEVKSKSHFSKHKTTNEQLFLLTKLLIPTKNQDQFFFFQHSPTFYLHT